MHDNAKKLHLALRILGKLITLNGCVMYLASRMDKP
jgi:hypothetical protein